MSAGHPHKHQNTRSRKELPELLKSGGAPELMKRWKSLDDQHDIHDLAGYDVAGTIRYIDRDFMRALFESAYATQILGAPIDTGLTPEQTIESILRHEAVEKVLLDSDNDVDLYLDAHSLATIAEHEKVRAFGGTPMKYERGLKAAIAFCEKKSLKNSPADLACAPMIDDGDDSDDQKALKQLRAAGVEDANKVARASVDYGKSTSDERCAGCEHWLDARAQELSRCAVTDGLVRSTRWCKAFESATLKEGTNGDEDSEIQNAPQGGDVQAVEGAPQVDQVTPHT